jgi:hypothetical protein
MLNSYKEAGFLLHRNNRLIGLFPFQNCAGPEYWRLVVAWVCTLRQWPPPEPK